MCSSDLFPSHDKARGTGAAIGSVIPGIGTAAGAIAGGIIGLGQTIGGWISGKDKV